MEYRVASHRGVQTQGGAVLKPGDIVDPKQVALRIERLIEKGFVVKFDPNTPAKPEPQGRTGPVSPSIWTLDPAPLQYLDLDILNILIMEKDDRVLEFETKEEAIAWLSQAYEAVEA